MLHWLIILSSVSILVALLTAAAIAANVSRHRLAGDWPPRPVGSLVALFRTGALDGGG
jgi:hypothetical protein